MSTITIEGTVVAAAPTKGGKWARLLLGGTGRINDLVMVPATHAAATAEPGDIVTLAVRPSVDTNAEGRPTKSIVYFLADGAAA